MTRWSDSLDQIYFDFAVAAILTPGTGTGADAVAVMAIDKTDGLEITTTLDAFQGGVNTIRPAACIRMVQLTEAGIAHADLDGGSLALTDKTWRIHSHLLRPTPDGELKGEVILFLLDESA